jgi:purine nucleosidase
VIHGESGLDSASATDALEEYAWGEDERDWMGAGGIEALFHPRAKTAAEAMYDAFVRHVETSGRRRPFVVVATGPLTNVATMILAKRSQIDLFPDECRPVIFCMGGAVGDGNTGARAEFNIQCDPEAAKIVFESGLRVYMIPLEVTHTAIVTPSVLDSLTTGGHFDSGKAGASAHAKQIRSLLTFFKDTYENVFDFKTGPPLHDPCAVWAAINFIEGATYDESETDDRFRDLFEFTHERVDVECESRLTYGQTVIDRWGTSAEPKNVYVARSMNVDRFWEAMRDAIQHRLSWMS